MTDPRFPPGFLWGAATAAHQVEGDNTGSDWWAWEQRPDSPVPEPSGRACEHYTRYADDVAILADIGLNTYRYSVEWARIEPEPGTFDDAELDHYQRMTDVVRAAGVTPMVTLNHFTLPQWLAGRGGWLADDAPKLFARYVDRVVRRLGDRVPWWCTLNEPGNVAVGGYLGVFGWPPDTRDLTSYERAADALVRAHSLGRDAVRAAASNARVGATHGMQEWESNRAGRLPMQRVRRMFEDVFLEASRGDDFVGVQTYTRVPVELPVWMGPLARLMELRAVRARVLPGMMRSAFNSMSPEADAPGDDNAVRRTAMGYEFRPQAIAATLRRAAELVPDTDLIVTEHGIATDDDTEREAFIRSGLDAVASVLDDGLPVKGYIYWSLLDNFEWAHGYRPRFGLVEVDRETMRRTVRPSAEVLGQAAR